MTLKWLDATDSAVQDVPVGGNKAGILDFFGGR